MESKRLDNAALAAGISPSYINAHGKPQSIAAVTKQRLLDAMHRSTAATKVAVNPLPNVKIFTHGKKMSLPVAGRGEYQWILTTEDGKQYQGKTRGGETLPLPAKLPEGYHSLTLTQEGERWHCRTIVAPARCYEPQPLKEGKSCGAPACSCIPCAQRKTGDRRFWRSAGHAAGNRPPRRVVYWP